MNGTNILLLGVILEIFCVILAINGVASVLGKIRDELKEIKKR